MVVILPFTRWWQTLYLCFERISWYVYIGSFNRTFSSMPFFFFFFSSPLIFTSAPLLDRNLHISKRTKTISHSFCFPLAPLNSYWFDYLAQNLFIFFFLFFPVFFCLKFQLRFEGGKIKKKLNFPVMVEKKREGRKRVPI